MIRYHYMLKAASSVGLVLLDTLRNNDNTSLYNPEAIDMHFQSRDHPFTMKVDYLMLAEVISKIPSTLDIYVTLDEDSFSFKFGRDNSFSASGKIMCWYPHTNTKLTEPEYHYTAVNMRHRCPGGANTYAAPMPVETKAVYTDIAKVIKVLERRIKFLCGA